MVLSIYSFSTGIIHRTYARRQPSVRSQIGAVCRGARASHPRGAVEDTLPALPGRAAHAPRTSRPRSQDEPPTLPRGVTRWSESVPPSQAYGAGFLESPCVPSPVSSIRTPHTPPSPLVGEEGRGDEGQKRLGIQQGKRASGERSRARCPRSREESQGGARASRPRRLATVVVNACTGKVTRWSEGVPPAQAYGAGFSESPTCHLPFQASGRQVSPFSPCGRRGAGG
jgi:hypothetical protein